MANAKDLTVHDIPKQERALVKRKLSRLKGTIRVLTRLAIAHEARLKQLERKIKRTR